MNTNNPMCPSAAKVLNAARGILESLYLISSTSYDISLLDQWCHLTWYMAGRALIRFLNAAIRHNYMDHVIVLHTEITYVHEMLGKAGERVPAAYRSKRLLFDILVQTCGEQFADPPSSSSVLAYISPAESTLVDRGPSKNLFGSFSSPPAGPGMQY
ncbi:hypothetical protein BC629DRAFT_1594898 [Irpex lacteus]|nr:hypothetical protein BC629DRAFT_1594898 [Irpex lacteus]